MQLKKLLIIKNSLKEQKVGIKTAFKIDLVTKAPLNYVKNFIVNFVFN